MQRLFPLLLTGLMVLCLSSQAQRKEGTASYYHPKFEGRKTASGEVFSNKDMTAASNHYPLGTLVRVTNKKNGKSVLVRINDRMGTKHRLIDLTEKAAQELCFKEQGLCTVVVEDTDGKLQEVLTVPEDSVAGNDK